MRIPFQHLLFFVALIFMTKPFVSEVQSETTNSETVLDKMLSHFPHHGTFEELLEQLAVQLRPSGIVNLETNSSSTSSLALSFDEEPSVRQILTQLCAADQAHRFALGLDARVINVFPSKSDKLTELLETKVAKFDMSSDTWPINWYSQVPESSDEVEKILENYYKHHERLVEFGGAGASMNTNSRPPHIELHLRNATVRDILNAIAVKELDWAANQNSAISNSGVSYPEFPFGWKAELRSTKDISLPAWVKSVFGPFPSATRVPVKH